MTEAVQAQHIMLATMSGALVVLFGALYALMFAMGRLQERRPFMWGAYLSYGLLFAATLVLAETLNLSGGWFTIVIAMLIGYLLAPHGIWLLCVGTHRGAGAHHDHHETGGAPP